MILSLILAATLTHGSVTYDGRTAYLAVTVPADLRGNIAYLQSNRWRAHWTEGNETVLLPISGTCGKPTGLIVVCPPDGYNIGSCMWQGPFRPVALYVGNPVVKCGKRRAVR